MLRRVVFSSGYIRRQAVRKNANSLISKRNDATVAATQSFQDEWESAKPFEDIPGPKPLPIIGNVWRFLPRIGDIPLEIPQMIDHFYKKYGNIVKVTGLPGRNNMVMVYNPEDCEKVYRNEGPWPRRESFHGLQYYRKVTRKDMFEGIAGLMSTQGEEWYNFRSKVNPILLQPRSTKLYVQPIDAVAADFIKRIRTIRDDQLEMPSNFVNEICKWGLESVVYISLDTRLGCLSGELEDDSEPQKVLSAINVMLESLFLLDVGMHTWKIISTPQWRKFVKAADLFNEVCLKYINEATVRLKTLKDPDRELTVLEKILARDSNPKIAMVMALDMITAGVDTTCYTAAIILYYLGINPEKQEKAFQEIGNHIIEKDQPVTVDILNELKYLKACIKEAMRLRPVVPGSGRTLVKDIVLSGYKIPKGTDAIMGHSYLSVMEKHFPQAEKYIPERWLKSDNGNHSKAKQTHPFVFMPFGHGARSCIGRRFALLELEILLAKMIRNFRIEYNYGEMKYTSKLLLIPVSPLKFKVVDRE